MLWSDTSWVLGELNAFLLWYVLYVQYMFSTVSINKGKPRILAKPCGCSICSMWMFHVDVPLSHCGMITYIFPHKYAFENWFCFPRVKANYNLYFDLLGTLEVQLGIIWCILFYPDTKATWLLNIMGDLNNVLLMKWCVALSWGPMVAHWCRVTQIET